MKTMNIAIRNGRVIDPANNLDRITDLFISDGRIASLDEPPADFIADQEIDATNLVVSPGLIDLCANLREPGYSRKGTIASETAAAAAGGITTLCMPPLTKPIADNTAVIDLIEDLARQAGNARVLPMGALTQELKGEQLSPMYGLRKAGCIGFTNAREPIHSSLTLARCLEYAATHDLLVIFQPQDADLAAGVPLPDALVSCAGASGNVVYRNAIMKVREDVTTGLQLTYSLRSAGIFPIMILQMVSIGEESGALDAMLDKCATFYEAEVDNAVDGLTSMMEPLIMAVLGVLVGGLMIAMYMPIFQIGSVV